MNENITEQLDKILALADSPHEGEAVVAVQKARQILLKDGLSFGDLARAASSRQISARAPGLISFLSGQRDHLESMIHYLRQQIDDLRAQMQTQDLQLAFWRRRAQELEQNSSHARGEAERWKNLARDTAEKLWDVGQSLKDEEFVATAALKEKQG